MSGQRQRIFLMLTLSVAAWKTVLSAEKDDVDPMGMWTPWGPWTDCSLPCGVGVQSRTRQCNMTDQYRGRIKNTCIGEYKQHETCNKKACRLGTKTVREQQCQGFNKKLIAGKRYRWQPYYNGGKKCELACRAKGHKFYAKLSKVVIDGTPCVEGDPYHICIDGMCKKVGCDAVLDSDLKFDKCGVCGGDNTTCHIISGIFTRTQLRYGYNHVTRFPKGACNINVTEMLPSSNYLGLRVTHGKYLINGNRMVGYSKDYQGAGTLVKYHHPDPSDASDTKEYILVKGPTNTSLDLVVGVPEDTKGQVHDTLIKQTDNRGILYSYTIPMVEDDRHSKTHSNGHHRKKHRHRHNNNDKDKNDQSVAEENDDSLKQRNEKADDKGKNALSYKTPPMYIEPEYKSRQKSQVEALNSKHKQDNYQQDEAERKTRYVNYLNQVRKQRQEARKRSNENKKRQALQNKKNENYGISNNNYYNHKPLSASQTKSGYSNVEDNNRQASGQGGVPIVRKSRVGVPLRPKDSSVGGVPLALQGSEYLVSNSGSKNADGSVYSPSGVSDKSAQGRSNANLHSQTRNSFSSNSDVAYNNKNNYYNPNRNSNNQYSSNENNVDNRNKQTIAQSQSFTQEQQRANRYRGSGSNVIPAPIAAPTLEQNPPHYALQGSEQSRYYNNRNSNVNQNRGFVVNGNQQQPNPGINYGQPQPGYNQSPQQPRPQPGINYGVKPGQPLQPNPLPDNNNIQDGAYPRRHSPNPYINYNQQPVYIPPNYAAQQGVQGFQLANSRQLYYRQTDGSISDQNYYPSGSNVQLGTLDTDSEYSWKISGFTECSRTCGGGTQETEIVCVKVDSQTVVTDNNCEDKVKPSLQSVKCSNTPCEPAWKVDGWSECSTTCGRGTRSRTVECSQRVSAAIQISVSASRCQGERRPNNREICNEDRPCVRWSIGEWSKCSAECGRGQRTREVVCLDSSDNTVPENKCDGVKPRALEICDMGSCAKTWFFTEWSRQCSTECGEGYQTRQVYCSAEPDRCRSIRKPEDKKHCKSDIPCGGKWFTGPWTKCSATCGEGAVSRDVVCMKKSGRALGVVGEENCLAEEKPISTEPCAREPCLPEWYMTKWTQCSRTCDTGTQTREVKCLDAVQEQSVECIFDTKPSARQSCNSESCQRANSGAHGSNDNKHSKGDQCEDTFKNCVLVVQARLCQYSYYKDVCCDSCHSHDQSPHHGDS